jgi:cysteinyl-tRNA synthetase
MMKRRAHRQWTSVLAGLVAILAFANGRAQDFPQSFAYVLQADSLAKTKADAIARLATSDRDWIVLDADFTSADSWTVADLAALRAGRPGRKVISYLSIGEAEDYRSYWRREWDANHDGKPDAGAPLFLLKQNPQWKGNYRVKYWDPEWQRLILRQLDGIMAAGFDGVYLDIVDGFETFERGEDDRINPDTNQSYRRDMVDWVKIIAARARGTNAAAIIIPQNGTQLLAHPDFLGVVNAVGVEDLFTNGNRRQKAADTADVLGFLAPLTAAGKPVLDVEYAGNRKLQSQARSEAVSHHFVWLFTDRQLATLGTSGQ